METITNKLAVIYCRVSTIEQVEEGNSLATQEKICRDYALQHGYDIAHVFLEKGESAKTINRTELKNMLNYCSNRKNNVKAVIAYKLDRISRNTDDYSQIRIILKRCNVEIKFTSEHFENTPAGRFMENIISNVSQFDNDVRTERSMNGMKEALHEGRYVWMAPVGYSNLKIEGKTTIAQNEMAPVIYSIFKEVAKNIYPPEEVRKQMKNKLVNKKGRPMARTYFYEILKNELYCGWMIKFGERIKGLFDPIVSQELFDQVQLILKHKGNSNRRYRIENEDFPLRRFITNPEGRKLTGGWCKGRKNKYPYYSFAGRMPVRKEILEAKFRDLMNSIRLNEKHFSAFKQLVKENLSDKMKANNKKRQILSTLIAELKNKQTMLIQKNLDGIISNSILQTQLENIETEIMNQSSELYRISNKKIDFEKLLELSRQLFIDPVGTWMRAPHKQRIAIQWFNFPNGLVFENNNFRTAEICSIYKEKNTFLSLLSAKGFSRRKTLNNPEMVTFNASQNSIVIQDQFWKKIDDELDSVVKLMKINN